MSDAACAHSVIIRASVSAGTIEGPCGTMVPTVRDRWTCRDCGTAFVPAALSERARHCDWLREDSARMETLISTMPDSFVGSRIELSYRLAAHRRELRELIGLDVDPLTVGSRR